MDPGAALTAFKGFKATSTLCFIFAFALEELVLLSCFGDYN